MKKKMMVSAMVLSASAMVCMMNVNAEIKDSADYIGEWYANYVIEGDAGIRMNVAGILGVSYTFTFDEDGTGISVVAFLDEEESEGEEDETMNFTWELTDGKIIVTMEDDSVMTIDEVDGEVIGDIGDDTYFVLGREFVEEEMDWETLLEQMLAQDEAEQANTPKENPYVYDPNTNNVTSVIGAFMTSYSYGDEYEITVDEEKKIFTADKPATEYFEADHIEGTYEITTEHFVNVTWTDEEYGFENTYLGSEYVEKWNTFTVKEDLSNLKEVIAAMASESDWEHEYTADSVTIGEEEEEIAEEGTVTVKDGDYEFTYNYKLVSGVDPIITLSYHDEEYGYDPEYRNYDMRQ